MLSRGTVDFFKALEADNSRDWFNANKAAYERDVKVAGEAFAAALAEELSSRLDLKFDHKIFRIYRDVRFSKDKTPYNTHLRVSARRDCKDPDDPGFMFSLEPHRLVLGAGILAFSKQGLLRWRSAAAGCESDVLENLLNALETSGVRLSDPELKRAPAPFGRDHPKGDLLRRKGLCAWIDSVPQTRVFGAAGPSACVDALESLFPLYEELRSLVGGT